MLYPVLYGFLPRHFKILGVHLGLVLDASCHLRTAVPSYNENDEMRDVIISPGLTFDASLLGPQPCGGSCTTAQTPCVLDKVIRTCLPVTIDAGLWCSFSSGIQIELMRISHISSPLPSRHGSAQISVQTYLIIIISEHSAMSGVQGIVPCS